jgi:hypothetical protein
MSVPPDEPSTTGAFKIQSLFIDIDDTAAAWIDPYRPVSDPDHRMFLLLLNGKSKTPEQPARFREGVHPEPAGRHVTPLALGLTHA